MSSCLSGFCEQIRVLELSCSVSKAYLIPHLDLKLLGTFHGPRDSSGGPLASGQDLARPASRDGPEGSKLDMEQAHLPSGATTRLVIWLIPARLCFDWFLIWPKARCHRNGLCIQHIAGRT